MDITAEHRAKESSTYLQRGALGKVFEMGSSLFSDCFLSQVIRIATPGPNLVQVERDWLRCSCSWRAQPAQMLSKPQTSYSSNQAASSFPLCFPSPPAHSCHLGGLHHPTARCSAMGKSSASGAKLLLQQCLHPS